MFPAGFARPLPEKAQRLSQRGWDPIVARYFLLGGFKFGGYGLVKTELIDVLGREKVSRNRRVVYFGVRFQVLFFLHAQSPALGPMAVHERGQ